MRSMGSSPVRISRSPVPDMAIAALDAGIDPRTQVTGECLGRRRRIEPLVERSIPERIAHGEPLPAACAGT
jgi:hypothetical protein